jgi:transportin-3
MPASCTSTAADAWGIIDQLLVKYGQISTISETACTVLRRAFDFFYQLLVPIAPAVIERMASCYQTTGLSGYLWITGKYAELAKGPGREAVAQAVAAAFDIESRKTFELLPTKTLTQNQDSALACMTVKAADCLASPRRLPFAVFSNG